jgi:chromosome segregation ATPase
MLIDKDFLRLNQVKQKLIDILFDLYKAGIPKPPVALRDHSEEAGPDSYQPKLNEYYALKILTKQGSNPSATSVHKLIGGKTDRVFQNVRWLKDNLANEFDALPVDPTAAPMEAVKRELVKVEVAQFKAELAEQERYAAEQLSKQAEMYEKRIRDLELKSSELAGKAGALLGLSEDHQRTIAHLESLLKQEAVNESELRNAQLLAEERKESLADSKAVIGTLRDQYEHYVLEAGKRSDQLKNDKDSTESREEVLRRELSKQIDYIDVVHKESETLQGQIAELSTQVQQNELTLKHEHEQSTLIASINDALKPLSELETIADKLASTSKKDLLNIESINTALHDVSSKVLDLTSRLEINTKPGKK